MLNWNLTKDDTILIQANVTHTLKTQKCSVQDILDSLLESAGTVLFPSFNVEWNDGVPFDIRSTPSRMGILSECARTYPKAVRSGHPTHGFVAIGHMSHLFNVNNFSGYGKDSPFAILRRLNGKLGILGLPDRQTNSFYHHIEEMNRVDYRFYKNFTGLYTDRYGLTGMRTYSFFCGKYKPLLDPVEEMMWDAGLYQGDKPFEGTGFRTISVNKMFDFVTNIIKSGKAEGLLWTKAR